MNKYTDRQTDTKIDRWTDTHRQMYK